MILLYTVMTTNMNNDTYFVNIKSVLTFSSKCTMVPIFGSLNY